MHPKVLEHLVLVLSTMAAPPHPSANRALPACSETLRVMTVAPAAGWTEMPLVVQLQVLQRRARPTGLGLLLQLLLLLRLRLH